MPGNMTSSSHGSGPASTVGPSWWRLPVLRDGTHVAVKVRRPDLNQLMHPDPDVLACGLRLVSSLFPGRLRRTNVRAFFTGFRRYSSGPAGAKRTGKGRERKHGAR